MHLKAITVEGVLISCFDPFWNAFVRTKTQWYNLRFLRFLVSWTNHCFSIGLFRGFRQRAKLMAQNIKHEGYNFIIVLLVVRIINIK